MSTPTPVEQMIIKEELRPQLGKETSSFRVLILTIIFSVLMPFPPLFVALLLKTSWFPDELGPAVENWLSQILVTMSGLIGVGSMIAVKGVVEKYIEGRSKVSEIKTAAALGVEIIPIKLNGV